MVCMKKVNEVNGFTVHRGIFMLLQDSQNMADCDFSDMYISSYISMYCAIDE